MPAKLQQFRTEDAKLVPAGYVDGPDGHRLPVGDALYVVWVLMNLRTLCNARYGVSEVAHALGDEKLAELGAIGFVERWKTNQVALYYWAESLTFMLATNPGMSEADVAPARAWATLRRSSFFWYLGPHAEGALVYDGFEEQLFVVKGLMQGLPFLIESQVTRSSAAPLLRKRVRLDGLAARADLNGKLAYAASYDAAAGRYGVVLEASGECVRVRAANLRAHGEADFPQLLYLTLLPFEGAITYDGIVCSPQSGEAWTQTFTRVWVEGGQATDVADRAEQLRASTPIAALRPEHAQRHCSCWVGGRAVAFGPGMPRELAGHQLRVPGDLRFVPPDAVGPTSLAPEAALERGWWNGDDQ